MQQSSVDSTGVSSCNYIVRHEMVAILYFLNCLLWAQNGYMIADYFTTKKIGAQDFYQKDGYSSHFFSVREELPPKEFGT